MNVSPRNNPKQKNYKLKRNIIIVVIDRESESNWSWTSVMVQSEDLSCFGVAAYCDGAYYCPACVHWTFSILGCSTITNDEFSL